MDAERYLVEYGFIESGRAKVAARFFANKTAWYGWGEAEARGKNLQKPSVAFARWSAKMPPEARLHELTEYAKTQGVWRDYDPEKVHLGNIGELLWN